MQKANATLQLSTSSKWQVAKRVTNFLLELQKGKDRPGGQRLKKVLRTVLLLDKDGNQLQVLGEPLDVDNALADPRFRSIRQRLKACFKGRSFFAKLRLGGTESQTEVHGEPVLTAGGEIAAVCISIEDSELEEEVSVPTDETEFVIQNMRQGFWRLNSFGLIMYANPYLANWLETTPEAMLGRHFSEFRRLAIVEGGELDDSLSQRFETEFVTTSGIVRRAIVVTSPAVAADGDLTGTVDLITDITSEHALQRKLVEEVQEMTKLASTDPLTGASNRSVFDTAIEELTAGPKMRCGLIVVDLDNFKSINDVYGHPAGDHVLVEVVERIKGCVRDGDIVARLGGDEFAILLPQATLQALREVAHRMAYELRFETVFDSVPIHVSVSVGSAHTSQDGADLLPAADRDMYRAKSLRHQIATAKN